MAKLAFIQGIRASAALAIIAFHLLDHISRTGYIGGIILHMGYTVMLFFVISGFVIYYTLERGTESNLNFYIRRVFRISPLFYIIFLIYVYYQWLILKRYLPSIELTLSTLTYTFNFYPPFAYGVEMPFYILSPLILHYINNLKMAISFFIVAVVISYFFTKTIPLFTPPDLIGFYTYAAFLNQLPIFVVGIMCYFIYTDLTSKIKYKLGASLTLGAAFVALMYFADGHDFLPNYVRGLAFGCLLIAVALNPTKLITNRAFLLLGDISYSTYLIHPLIVSMLFPSVYSKIHDLIGFGIEAYIMCYIITLIILLPIAYLSYILIEKQGIKIGQKLILYKQRTHK